METLRNAQLRYNGIDHPDYQVLSDARLFRRLKSEWKTGKLKGKHKWKPMKPYPLGGDNDYWVWSVKNPLTGKHRPIVVSSAVAQSFADPGVSVQGLVAAHGPGTKRSDAALGTCVLKTQKENRADRRRDGTYSTGHAMKRDKLRGRRFQVAKYRICGWSKSAIAKLFGVSRQAISYCLKKQGLS
jgi:hypothetical protein